MGLGAAMLYDACGGRSRRSAEEAQQLQGQVGALGMGWVVSNAPPPLHRLGGGGNPGTPQKALSVGEGLLFPPGGCY